MSKPSDSKARACAYCRKAPVVPAFRPFCSEGCRSRDLNAWLSDRYVVPAASEEDELSVTSPLDNGDEAG
ncbi:DNA gyrase inhibitor YacG [Sandarakinorhabdus oryzae]|uniref:DNA gyrase inhibitor YacG n=1 Tax=Sandarakinorhabdus oryzae TaxID=2675220 RepID=UPI0018CC5A34|nr:DNA gyrase inhibitor YacG [Sandarakinorhabdus oryzae]